MSTDRELLELAAKAAGVFLTPETMAQHLPKWEWTKEDEPRHLKGGGMSGTVLVYNYSGELSGTTRQEWHPLTDDGDALRLAVKLALEIRPGVGMVTAAGNGVWEEVPTAEYSREEATRRAIVRAAAEIGKTL